MYIIAQVTMMVEGKNVENIGAFLDTYPGAKIVKIDGKNADQICESCEKAIQNGDKCFQWSDDIFTCFECGGENDDHDPIVLESGES